MASTETAVQCRACLESKGEVGRVICQNGHLVCAECLPYIRARDRVCHLRLHLISGDPWGAGVDAGQLSVPALCTRAMNCCQFPESEIMHALADHACDLTIKLYHSAVELDEYQESLALGETSRRTNCHAGGVSAARACLINAKN
jgi:hypothetical protein